MQRYFMYLMGLIAAVSADNHYKSVTTDSGTVEGRLNKAEVLGSEVYEFLGIPFAEPPVGDLRFKKPVAKAPWQGTFEASKMPNSCPQMIDTAFGDDFQGSQQWNPNTAVEEDCLYLNIWVPRRVMESSDKHAVMIWIFGGGFTSGTATLDLYHGAALAAVGNVIVVTVQYRLGSLGFLYFGTEEAPGNMGLWDQTLAMQWVYDNIQYFNGDNARTTLFGESAGAASIAFHLLSPHSEKLFSRAILQSSSALSDYSFLRPEQGLWRSEKLFGIFSSDCSLPNSNVSTSEKVECLKEQPFTRFPEADYGVLAYEAPYGYAQFPFVPVIDGDLLPDHPRKMLASGKFKKANLMGGFNRNEGSYFMLYSVLGYGQFQHPFAMDRQMSFTERDYSTFIDEFFAYYPRDNVTTSTPIRMAISHEYEPSSLNSTDLIIEALDAATGDWAFACPVVEWFEEYNSMATGFISGKFNWLKNSNIPNSKSVWQNFKTLEQYLSGYYQDGIKLFLYHFSHRASNQYWPEWMGVMHADEIAFVFGHPFFSNLSDPYTFKEQLLSWKMMTYWSNFAKTGNPNDEDCFNEKFNEDNLAYWPEYTRNSKVALELSVETLVDKRRYAVTEDVKAEKCKFWKAMATQFTKLNQLLKR